MGWLCPLPWALGWLWGFGASTGTAGTAGGVPLHQLALGTQRLAPGEVQAVLSMVRGCEVEVEAAAARLRAAWIIHTLKVVHRLDAEPLSKKSP